MYMGALTIAIAVAVSSLHDGIACNTAEPQCSDLEGFRYPTIRNGASSMLFVHAIFAGISLVGCEGSHSKPYLVIAFATDISMGLSQVFMASERSGIIVALEAPVLRQRLLFAGAATVAFFNDAQLVLQLRYSRMIATTIAVVCLGAVRIATAYTSSTAGSIILIVLYTASQSYMFLSLILEVLPGPLDDAVGYYTAIETGWSQISTGLSHEPEDAQESGGQLASNVSKEALGTNGLQSVSTQSVRDEENVISRSSNILDPAIASSPLQLAAAGTMPSGFASTNRRLLFNAGIGSHEDGRVDRSRVPSESFACHKLSGLQIIVFLAMFSGMAYAVQYYGVRYFGMSQSVGEIAFVISDILVVTLRYMTSVAIVQNDFLLVAMEAAQRQRWKRVAADKRLGTIQDFTRFIFQEARAPLQAVSLAVRELEATLGEIKAASLAAVEETRVSGIQRDGFNKECALLQADIVEALDVLRSQHEGCKGLQHIFDDVLEAQRVQQGKLRIRDEVVRMKTLLDDLLTTFRRTAESRGISLTAEMVEGAPDYICSDTVRIKQVVANLLSNALKFTPAGGTVALMVHPVQDLGDSDSPIQEAIPRSSRVVSSDMLRMGLDDQIRVYRERAMAQRTNMQLAGANPSSSGANATSAASTNADLVITNTVPRFYRPDAITTNKLQVPDVPVEYGKAAPGMGSGGSNQGDFMMPPENGEGLMSPLANAVPGVQKHDNAETSRSVPSSLKSQLRTSAVHLGSSTATEMASSSGVKNTSIHASGRVYPLSALGATTYTQTAWGVEGSTSTGEYRLEPVHLRVEVKDSGCGITPQDISELFTPYKQTRHGVEYTGSSSGLGLYISRGIARQMGGDLVAQSAGIDKGTTFVFDFTGKRPTIADLQQRPQRGRGRRPSGSASLLGSIEFASSKRGSLYASRSRGNRRSHQGEARASSGSAASNVPRQHSEFFAAANRRADKGDAAGQIASSVSRAMVRIFGDDRSEGTHSVANLTFRMKMSSSDSQSHPDGGLETYGRAVSAGSVSLAPGGARSQRDDGSSSQRNHALPARQLLSVPESTGSSSSSLTSGVRRGSGADVDFPNEANDDRQGFDDVQIQNKRTNVVEIMRELKQWCLVVDDVPTNRKLLARGLKRLGYTTYQAEDGSVALCACRQRAMQMQAAAQSKEGANTRERGRLVSEPEIGTFGDMLPTAEEVGMPPVGVGGQARPRALGLVIMDKSMPVMDGIQATRTIRAEFGPQFVIVGLTGDALGADLDSFLAEGLDDVLGKPASAAEVHAVVRDLLSLSSDS